MTHSRGFFEANDTTAGVEVRIAPDGHAVSLRVLPIGSDDSALARFCSWITRRPRYSATWFLRRLDSGKADDLVAVLESFWKAVECPELKYLTPEETLDAIGQFFRGGSLDERATRANDPNTPADDVQVNWTAIYAEFCATYGIPDPRTPWTRFLVLAEELEGQEARERLRLMDSSFWGTARAFPGQSAALLDNDRRAVAEKADVVRRPRSRRYVIQQQPRSTDA